MIETSAEGRGGHLDQLAPEGRAYVAAAGELRSGGLGLGPLRAAAGDDGGLRVAETIHTLD